MKRRDFLKLSTAAVAGACVSPVIAQAPDPKPSGRNPMRAFLISDGIHLSVKSFEYEARFDQGPHKTLHVVLENPEDHPLVTMARESRLEVVHTEGTAHIFSTSEPGSILFIGDSPRLVVIRRKDLSHADAARRFYGR